MTQYVTCEWFGLCTRPSEATVTHPTLGDVEICAEHLTWLLADGPTPSPTKMLPPMAARHLTSLR